MRLSPAADSYLLGLIAAVEACGVEIREGIDYRTARELTSEEWVESVAALADVATDLRAWALEHSAAWSPDPNHPVDEDGRCIYDCPEHYE